jgi:hypothetical protein
MARRTGAIAATVTIDTGDFIVDRSVTRCGACFNLDNMLSAVMGHKGNLGHDLFRLICER